VAHRVAADVDFELDDIWLYIAKQSGSVEIATSLIEAITDCFSTIGRNPKIGRRRDDDLEPGLLSFPVGSYVIIYCLVGGDALILHVFHGSRDIESFFGH
jgi:toxin ParE1/3/4